MKNNKPFFSPNFMAEFKKWMDDKEGESQDVAAGSFVTTSLKLKTLVERIDCIKTGDYSALDVAKYFIKQGGIVKEVNGENVVIKTKRGIFSIDKDDIKMV